MANFNRRKRIIALLEGALLAGIVGVVGVLIGVVQIGQTERDSRQDNDANATLVAVLKDQLELQRELATVQAVPINPDTSSTIVAEKLNEIENELKNLEGTRVALENAIEDEKTQWAVQKDYTNEGSLSERNTGNGWSLTTLDENVSLSVPFRLKIHFLDASGQSNAIHLVGHATNSDANDWWEGLKRFEVGLGDGAWVFINLRDGNQLDPFVIESFLKPKDGIVIVQSDQQGKQILILDSDENVIRQINTENIGDFPEGMFPQGINFIELSSGPESEMVIEQLLLLEQIN